MTQGDFTISVTDEAVDVSYTPSASEPRGKLFGFIFVIGTLVACSCAFLLLPGRSGEGGIWQALSRSPADSSDFLMPLTGLAVFNALLGWQGFRYARAAWASDETFHCDRNAITISRIPWLDFSNSTWRTHTFPLAEVSAIRFAVIASAKGRAFWGIRFRDQGRKWALPGLEAPEAKIILDGLKTLGANVLDDPKLDKRIQQTLGTRINNGSWLNQ